MEKNELIGMQIISNTFDDLTAFQLADGGSNVAPKFCQIRLPQYLNDP